MCVIQSELMCICMNITCSLLYSLSCGVRADVIACVHVINIFICMCVYRHTACFAGSGASAAEAEEEGRAAC